MMNSGDVSGLPMWLKLALLIAGTILMFTGADVIPVDASQFHTPHWVVFVAGVAFSCVGVISFLSQQRGAHPARYLFAVGVLMTCLFVTAVAVSIYASGTAVVIGPFLIKGIVADEVTRSLYAVGALIIGVLTLAVWRSWYRAISAREGSAA